MTGRFVRIILLAAVLTAWSSLVRAEAVTPDVELDKTKIMAGQEQSLFLLVDFKVAEAEKKPASERPKINLGLVLDRSGSMNAKGKMDYLKTAAKLVVDRLEPTDRLAVVEYDDRISVLWPSSPVEAKEMIKKRIDGLSPRGRTNLSGGLMKGVEEVKANLNSDEVNRVILLSDGLANEGVTQPALIAALVRKAKASGVAVSTMGLGLQFNEDLMQAVAQNGGGTYYFIENPQQMSAIFQREISILFATVARDVKVSFVKSPAVDRIEVYGYPASHTDQAALITMEDFFSGEKRSVLLRLRLKPAQAGPVDIGKLELAYLDVPANQSRLISRPLTVTAVADQQLVLASVNKKVKSEAALTEADKRHGELVKLFQKGKPKEARAGMAKLAKDLAETNKDLKDVRLSKKVEALEVESEQIDKAAAAPSPAAGQAYLKQAKQRLYQSQKGKRGMSVLQAGDSGYEVERLQKVLKKEGLYKGAVDGKFTAELTEALKAYQTKKSLTPDGVAGPKTMQALGLY